MGAQRGPTRLRGAGALIKAGVAILISAGLVSGCAMFRAPAHLPVTKVDKTHPVLSKSKPDELVGQCVQYRADGSYSLQKCDPIVTAVLGTSDPEIIEPAQHVTEVLWVKPESQRTGPHGYFHAHEAHIMQSHGADLAPEWPSSERLLALDNLCHNQRYVRSHAVITRVFSGCSVIKRGTYLPGSGRDDEGPRVSAADLERPCERWGRPVGFRSDGAAHSQEQATCNGELWALKFNTLPLQDLCHDYVRLLVVEELRSQLRGRRVAGEAPTVSGRRNVAFGAQSPQPAPTTDRLDAVRERLRLYEDDPYAIKRPPQRLDARRKDKAVDPSNLETAAKMND